MITLTWSVVWVFSLVWFLQNVAERLSFYKNNIAHLKIYVVREFERPKNDFDFVASSQYLVEKKADFKFEQWEENFLYYTNIYRQRFSAKPVVLDKWLSNVAQWYAKYMYYNHHFSHIDLGGKRANERAIAMWLNYTLYWENLAHINGDTTNLPDIESYVVTSWEDSPTHSKIMQDVRWSHIWFWAYEWYFVQLFAM